MKNANISTNLSQSFRVGGNTGISNILKDINTSQTIVKKNENEINKILGEVNTSQTMNKRKDQQVNDILKDVETTATNFNKNNKNIDNNNNQNLQSIDDIRKIFNNDYPNSNLYNNNNNNNLKDSRMNNIFKSEMIPGDNRFMLNNKGKGSEKPVIPKFKQNYEYGYNKPTEDNGQYMQNENGQNNKYNINPKHMNKINAIINLLEELNLENLIHVK